MKDLVCEETHVHENAAEKVKANMYDDDLIYDLAELFKVFSDSTRAKILSCLEISELCVCDICECLNMNKSAISHQLRILRQAKLVKARKRGKEVMYSLDDEHVSKIFECGISHLQEKD